MAGKIMLKCLSIRYERAEGQLQVQQAKGPVGTCVSMFCPQTETTPMTKQFRAGQSSCTFSWQQLQSSCCCCCRVVACCRSLFVVRLPAAIEGFRPALRLWPPKSAANNRQHELYWPSCNCQLPVVICTQQGAREKELEGH